MGRIAIKEAAALSAPGLGSAQALELARHAQVRILGVPAGDARIAATGVDLGRAHVP